MGYGDDFIDSLAAASRGPAKPVSDALLAASEVLGEALDRRKAAEDIAATAFKAVAEAHVRKRKFRYESDYRAFRAAWYAASPEGKAVAEANADVEAVSAAYHCLRLADTEENRAAFAAVAAAFAAKTTR